MRDRAVLNMEVDREDFLRSVAPAIIDDIKGDEQPLWGMMTVQHMLEHLTIPLNFAIGTLRVPAFIPEEKIPRQREFLYSVFGLPKNFKAPFLPADENPPYMTKTLDEAKTLLKQTIQRFFEAIQSSEFSTENHPVFGPLNTYEWLIFQYKHFSHHFMQFGLIPLPPPADDTAHHNKA
jgi:oxepin-CoA hydrolase/3-oxo-5,6-dehydrosuberyl-CoA semialdehyde dehydrogenase